VSSFGSGGTNAHVVVEEAPELPPSGPSRPWQVLPLSAKTPEALDRATTQLSDFLKSQVNSTAGGVSATALADAVFTLQTGRTAFHYRRIVVCQDSLEGAEALKPKTRSVSFHIINHLLNGRLFLCFQDRAPNIPAWPQAFTRPSPYFARK
jgi:hypothetical protein